MLASAVLQPYAAILFVIGVAVVMAFAILALTHVIGTKRRGPVKDEIYESGMPPVMDARRRFNVRFYVVAMVFLLFDVEVVFLWPWAPVFHASATRPGGSVDWAGLEIGKGFLLAEMAVFLGILLVGYVYAWRKGVFKWE